MTHAGVGCDLGHVLINSGLLNDARSISAFTPIATE